MTALVFRTEVVSYGLMVWVSVCTFCLFAFVHGGSSNSDFFRIGPSESLVIFGIKVDTGGRYVVVLFYTAVSTIVRTLQQEVISPWIIQNVQNEKAKSEHTCKHGYAIVTIDVLYRWFDWYMYMNILLAQVDMMVVELTGNVLASLYMTKVYLRHSVVEGEGDDGGREDNEMDRLI